VFGVVMVTHCGVLASATGALWSATGPRPLLMTMQRGALTSPTVIRAFGVVTSRQYAGALCALTGALCSPTTTSTVGAL
jgi:hypothetical protein